MTTYAATVRAEIATTLTAHGHHCAAAMCGAATGATWLLIARDCEALGTHRSGTYAPSVVRRAVDAMSRGDVEAAARELAACCGMSVAEWAADAAATAQVSA